MNSKEYIKTYKPLLAWIIGYPAITIIIIKLLSGLSTKISVLISLIIMVVGLYILMLVIYKGEYVYWINGGPSYEEAKEAGSKKRKEYAKEYLDVFLKMMLRTFLYGIISLIFKFSMWWIDLLFISLIVIITVFSTSTIKFNK